MKSIQPKTFDSIRQLNCISLRAMEEHYRLYTGYVEKYNKLTAKFAYTLVQGGAYMTGDMQSMKVDITYALAAIKNHELFFDILGGDGSSPTGDLAATISSEFGGMDQYLSDLRQTSMASRGWCWTAYDIDHGNLFNYPGSTQSAIPVWNTLPIVGIDMYGHAYLYDFGNNRRDYVEAVLKNLDWSKVAARLEVARGMAAVR
jgi:Fe-Mn family superoxide dismutase